MSEMMNGGLPLAPSVETTWRAHWKGSRELCQLLPVEKIAVGPNPDFEIPYGVLGETKTEFSGLTNIGSLVETSLLRLKVIADSKNFLDSLLIQMRQVFAEHTGFRFQSITTVGAENRVWTGTYDWDYTKNICPGENEESGGNV